MTIEEAIEHCINVSANDCEMNCKDCRAGHMEIAEWLGEYEGIRSINVVKVKRAIKFVEGLAEEEKKRNPMLYCARMILYENTLEVLRELEKVAK